MTWLMADDQLALHPKFQALDTDAMALWLVAGTQCAGRNTGVIPPALLGLYTGMAKLKTPKRARTAVAEMVTAGIWHDDTTVASCGRCADAVSSALGRPLAAGEHYWHDWTAKQLKHGKDADPVDKKRERRRKDLWKATGLVDFIRERDQGMCRYCTIPVVFGQDHRSQSSGTLDHVDPDGPNTAENVVVACRRCNGIKRDRTPEQAGMRLLPVPPPYQSRGNDPIQTQPESGLDPIQTQPEPTQTRSEPDPPSRRTRDGSGRVETGSGSGPDRVGIGSGPGWVGQRAGPGAGGGSGRTQRAGPGARDGPPRSGPPRSPPEGDP